MALFFIHWWTGSLCKECHLTSWHFHVPSNIVPKCVLPLPASRCVGSVGSLTRKENTVSALKSNVCESKVESTCLTVLKPGFPPWYCLAFCQTQFPFLPYFCCSTLNRIKWNFWTLCGVWNSSKSQRGTTDWQYSFFVLLLSFQPSLHWAAFFCFSCKKKISCSAPQTLSKYIYCYFPVYYWSLLTIQTFWERKLENT